PALGPEVRAALALKVICGLPVAAIARLFLVSEATMFQRITRAKEKVRAAGIPFELPPRRAWPERLGAVLLALELAFTAAYADAGGELSAALEEDLGAEVERLALLVAELLPEEPEALGLAAQVLLARSRHGARLDGEGVMVPLSKQDVALWDAARIERARVLMDRAAAGLAAIEALPAERLAAARPWHVARADLLAGAGRGGEAAAALEAALALQPPRAERLWLERWRDSLG
ncbi:MAG: DUF6596 domain-containing protein, partial [Erythrobacter sp.]